MRGVYALVREFKAWLMLCVLQFSRTILISSEYSLIWNTGTIYSQQWLLGQSNVARICRMILIQASPFSDFSRRAKRWWLCLTCQDSIWSNLKREYTVYQWLSQLVNRNQRTKQLLFHSFSTTGSCAFSASIVRSISVANFEFASSVASASATLKLAAVSTSIYQC